VGFNALALITPKASESGGGTQFPASGPLLSTDLCRRCLQCLVPLPPRARPDRRFYCEPCHAAWWRRHGGVRKFEARYGAEGLAVILSLQREFLTGEPIPRPRPIRRHLRGKDGRFWRPQPAPEGPRLTWNEYKALHGLDRRDERKPAEPPKKRRHGPGCRYKPMGIVGAGEAQERGVVGETPNLAARLQGIAAPKDFSV